MAAVDRGGLPTVVRSKQMGLEITYRIDPDSFALDLAELPGPVEGDGDSGDTPFNYEEKYAVTVMCESAADQELIYNELKERGYECRVVVV